MRIAVMQATANVGDLDANLATIDARAADAAARGADVLVTPELFVTGYAPRRLHGVEPAQQTQIVAAVGEIARRHGVAVLASHPEVATAGDLAAGTTRTDDDGDAKRAAVPPAPSSIEGIRGATPGDDCAHAQPAQHIAATLFDAAGREALHYRKVNLFDDDEAAAFTPGCDAPRAVEVAGLRVAVVICFDVEYPEMVRAAALAGADVVLVPTALAAGFDDVPQVLVRARALENGVGVVYANHVGVEDGLTFGGGSVIVGPDGAVLAQAGDEAALIVADVTGDDVTAARDAVPYLAKLRRDTYASWR